jgi:hypothetical protein
MVPGQSYLYRPDIQRGITHNYLLHLLHIKMVTSTAPTLFANAITLFASAINLKYLYTSYLYIERYLINYCFFCIGSHK